MMPYLHLDLAKGEAVATPTQEMPFKAVIYADGKILEERFFPTRPEAEAYIVDALQGLNKQSAEYPEMPRSPKGGCRLADVIRNVVLVMRIATGEIADAATLRKSFTARRFKGVGLGFVCCVVQAS
jgi:hypothetical protein